MTKRRSSPTTRLRRFYFTLSAWPLCYSTVVLLAHSYLLYQAIKRYLLYRFLLPSTSGYHLGIICTAAIILPFTVLISFIRLGSYANDAVQVGFGLLKTELADKRHPAQSRLLAGMPPIAVILHVISGYLLLIVNVFIVAKGKQLGVSADTKNSEFFLEDMPLIAKDLNSTNYYIRYVTLPSTNFEFANFLLSLTVCLYRTVSVFWQSNRLFVVIYWLQSLLAIALHVLSYIGLVILYTGICTAADPSIFILNKPGLVVLYIASNFVLFTSNWCIFHFGYGTVLDKMWIYLKHLGYHKRAESDCGANTPHALALVSILLYVGCNSPIMYDYVTMYANTKNQLLIAHLIACVVYMLLWIVLWFSFTVKQDWDFKINELALKRYAVLQNRQRIFARAIDADAPNGETASCHSDDLPTNTIAEESYINSEDNISNSTTSTNNGCTPRSTNGILSYKLQSRLKRKSTEQKVKFQEATKIVIETNLDSDLDTIPESDTECADSAMFSGSGGSNDSNENQIARPPNPNPSSSQVRNSSYRDLILNPKNVQLLARDGSGQQQQHRMWSSTGDLDNSMPHKYQLDQAYINRPGSAISEQYTTPYSPRNHTRTPESISNSHQLIISDATSMSSAV